MKLFLLGVLSIMPLLPAYADGWEYSSRVQYMLVDRTVHQSESSENAGIDDLQDNSGNLRLMAEGVLNKYEWGSAYQFLSWHTDALSVTSSTRSVLPDDQQRLFDLSHTIHHEDKNAIVHRIDRLYIGKNNKEFSWRAGRYAVSWGNGLVYNPMDIFNPFDPVAIDKEYKTGDDMFYMQASHAGSNDIQLLLVPRRNIETGKLRTKQSSLAVKYHGLSGFTDYDILIAQHYDDLVTGVGFAHDFDGVLWRSDFTYTFADNSYAALVTSLSYAWNWNQKPVYGFIEYFYAGYGLEYHDGYDADQFSNNQELLERLQRGEAFTLSQHYLAPGIDYEWHPLLRVMPTLFINLYDHSMLMQILLKYEHTQNFILNLGANLSSGDEDSEYGGGYTQLQSDFLSTRRSAFLQLNYYF